MLSHNKKEQLLAPGTTNSVKTLSAACGNGIAGVLIFGVLPILLGGFSEQYDLNDIETGMLGSTYFGLYALVSFTSIFWIQKLNWRRLSTFGVGLMIFGILCCRLIPNYNGALFGLALAGIGAALTYPISFTLIACRPDKDRDYAIKLIPEQLVPGLLLLLIASFFTEQFSIFNFLLILALLLILPALLTRWLPYQNPKNTAADSSHKKSTTRIPAIMGLVALNLYFMGFAGLWAFLELIGTESHINDRAVGQLLSLGLLTSAIGPFVAAYIGDKYGRTSPLLFATAGSLLPLLLGIGTISTVNFGIMLAAIPFAYYFGISYFFAVIADADSDGKFASLMPFALASGAAFGPAIFGAMKTWTGIEGAYIFAALCIILGVTLIFSINSKFQLKTLNVRAQ